MRTRTYTVSVSRWFPADDPIAIAVAKLCVLREDYFLELRGLVLPGAGHFEGGHEERGIPGLDDNSATWRRLYFFRNSIRTLNEIRNLVDRMHVNSLDKEALARESESLIEGFKELKRQLKEETELVKELRDSVGGHVLHADVKKVLEGMNRELSGFFQDGEIRGTIRYKFTSELVLAMMLEKVAPENEQEKLETLVFKTSGLIKIIGTMDKIIRAYIISRKLLLSS